MNAPSRMQPIPMYPANRTFASCSIANKFRKRITVPTSMAKPTTPLTILSTMTIVTSTARPIHKRNKNYSSKSLTGGFQPLWGHSRRTIGPWIPARSSQCNNASPPIFRRIPLYRMYRISKKDSAVRVGHNIEASTGSSTQRFGRLKQWKIIRA